MPTSKRDLGQRGEQLAAADTLLQATGATLVTPEQTDYRRILSQVRTQLDETTFESLWAAAQTMPLDEAMNEAMRE